ncbi:hypothetical protein P3T23_004516 [Paraburkholderia sp. GAS448]|uniref:lytic transglycosylase domain-containing protein n=1 Tax=Paraburkholderia sp. GAS448 TaxID=3035136 RepID=UPI003D1B5879
MSHPADIQRYISMAQQAGTRHGVPPELLVGQIRQESGFNPDAVSPAGAVGISQFMPGTAKQYGIDPRDPAQSIDAQARMMKSLYGQFGSWRDALHAYNWGEGNHASYLRTGKGVNGQPMPAETQQYPDLVLGHAKDHSGGQLPAHLQVAALDSNAAAGRDLMGGPSAQFTPSAVLHTPQGPHVAMPSTQEEHDLMSGIASRGYAPDVERQLVGALAQLLPARDVLDGRDMLGDEGLPDELDPLIRQIVEKA